VTRVFSTGHRIYVYFQAYKPAQLNEQSPANAQPANVPAQPNPTALRVCQPLSGRQELFETAPQSVAPSAASRLGVMSLSFDLGVDDLPRGSTTAR